MIVVRASGPLLFRNLGGGKFRAKPGAFHFENPPRGTFTGAAIADYDRDGWLDIYFCLYAFYGAPTSIVTRCRTTMRRMVRPIS